MNESMNKWSKSTLIEWVNTLSTINSGQKTKIINGINSFGAAGKDVFDADKDDLADSFEIGGMLAGKLYIAIGKQKNKQFQDKIGGNNNNNNKNNKNNNNNNNDNCFSLNLQGQRGAYCTIDKIKESYTVRYLKEQYLDYYGHDLKNEAKRKGLTIYRMGEKLQHEHYTLKQYNVVNDSIPLDVIFRVDGGMAQQNVENNGVTVSDAGRDVDRIQKPMSEWTNIDVQNWIKSLGGSSAKLVSKLEDMNGHQLIQLNKTDLLQITLNTMQINKFLEHLENAKNKYNILENETDKKMEETAGSTHNTEILFCKGQEIEYKKDGKWHKAKIEDVEEDKLMIKYDSFFSNNVWSSIDYVLKDEWCDRIKNRSSTSIKKKENNGSNWAEIPMNEWRSNHVQCWVESLGGPFKKKADKFKDMNGKELLDTDIDDLSLRITSKMQRRKFMDNLEEAKKKYNIITEGAMRDKSRINGIVGLENLGNTCFMNTSIQLLSQTPILTKFLAKRAKTNKKRLSKSSMLDCWSNLCDVIYNQSNHGYRTQTFSPSNIKNVLLQIDSDFGSGEQDDSSRSLRVMLGALDKEIEAELQIKKNKNNNNITDYMNLYEVTNGNELKEDEEEMIIEELLSKHNPKNSLIRKLFDGIERVIYTCYSCKFKYIQYKTFRVLDIPVISNKITFNNISIVFNDNYYKMPQCTALDYSSCDVLKFKIIQFLKKKNKNSKNIKQINLDDVKLINMGNNGNMEEIPSNTALLTLQQSHSNVFALINKENDDDANIGDADLLQFVIYIDKNNITMQYKKCNANRMGNYIRDEFDQYSTLNEEYNFIIKFNNKLINTTNIRNLGIDNVSNNKCNLLILLCVEKSNNKFVFKNENIDTSSCNFAKAMFKELGLENGLIKLKQMLLNVDISGILSIGKTENETNNAKHQDVEKIDNTLNELKKIENINGYINDLFSNKFKTISNGSSLLRDLNECLKEYQHSIIIDQTRFSYKCRGCKKQCRILKLEKQIIYTPSILVLHLDRFGKNVSNVNPNQEQKLQSIQSISSTHRYKKNEKISVLDRRDNKWYKSTVIVVKANKIKIHYDGYQSQFDEWIDKIDYMERIRTINNFNNNESSNWSSNWSSTGSSSRWSSNKFDHGIKYGLHLKIGKYSTNNNYDLYGVSNHSGGTQFGHYTANIKCLSNNDWYDISDSSVSKAYSPLNNTKSATILMYSQNK